MTLICCPHLHY